MLKGVNKVKGYRRLKELTRLKVKGYGEVKGYRRLKECKGVSVGVKEGAHSLAHIGIWVMKFELSYRRGLFPYTLKE